jgi:uncharacterized protein
MTVDFLESIGRQAAATDHLSHRPWPLPEDPWLNAQSWIDVAFLHWRIEEPLLRRHLPRSLELDTYGGAAWLGITPFLLDGFRLRGLPPVPRVSTFPELNVRTYVVFGDRPGIWFFSLDAGSTLAVEAAKRVYRLPYHRAQMHCVRDGDFVRYEAARPGGAFSARYRGVGPLRQAEPGSLEHFLTERYCFYTQAGGRVLRAEIHHPPWDLQEGEADIDLNTMAPLRLPDTEPHVLFSPRQDVVVWPLQGV